MLGALYSCLGCKPRPLCNVMNINALRTQGVAPLLVGTKLTYIGNNKTGGNQGIKKRHVYHKHTAKTKL